ncbi:hypothetical protein GK677_02875 [Bifidobacteriaceae bacterium NR044]|nr:hypothetical protein [Bifidobacteriaceae bacterium NR043]MBF9353709.1 hypothetical protein [Bifidobacteriaceae bacterium NR044]
MVESWFGAARAAARMLAFADQQESASAEHWCKASEATLAGDQLSETLPTEITTTN